MSPAEINSSNQPNQIMNLSEFIINNETIDNGNKLDLKFMNTNPQIGKIFFIEPDANKINYALYTGDNNLVPSKSEKSIVIYKTVNEYSDLYCIVHITHSYKKYTVSYVGKQESITLPIYQKDIQLINQCISKALNNSPELTIAANVLNELNIRFDGIQVRLGSIIVNNRTKRFKILPIWLYPIHNSNKVAQANLEATLLAIGEYEPCIIKIDNATNYLNSINKLRNKFKSMQ
jgi:hypothetical protein